MAAQENKLINLLDETTKALANHGYHWHNVKCIKNEVGLIPIAKFVTLAQQTYYDNNSDLIEIDPSLKLFGVNWWFQRFNVNGKEGWEFCKMPKRPTIEVEEPKIYNQHGFAEKGRWQDRIEK